MENNRSIFTFTIIIIMISCNPIKPTLLPYELPHSELAGKSWEGILGNQKTKIDSFKILHTGSVKVPLDGMLNTDKLATGHGLEEQLWVKVFVYLFHHREKGWFMIDTGLDSTFQHEGNIKGIMAGNYILESRQEPGQNIAAQLRQENKEIKGIFLTHLHGDHSAGMPELDPTILKYMGKGEHYVNLPFLYQPNHVTEVDVFMELDWSQGIPLAPFKSVIDVFGDGSFLAIHTPGHSDGHLSYLLMTGERPVLLTGDACHTAYGFTNAIEPGWTDDQEAAANSLTQLIQFHKQYPEVKIQYGHED